MRLPLDRWELYARMGTFTLQMRQKERLKSDFVFAASELAIRTALSHC